MISAHDVPSLRVELLEHFDLHRRALPWRESAEPYRVWVSEIMLQQTRVETAAPYFERWMARFPTVEALANADEEQVLKAWEGLGYYSRARNLHRSARIVREELNGVIPADSSGLRGLPGIGEYSAGAIASIAFGEAVPAVDGNVRRVIARLFDVVDPAPAMLRERAAMLLDTGRPGDWNQAMMELGATICLPRAPRCDECPIRDHCAAQRNGTQESRPGPKKRTRVRESTFAVLVVANTSGDLLLVRRPHDGMLGGLWEFPSAEIAVQDDVQETCLGIAADLGITIRAAARWATLAPVKHVFSHLKALYRPLLCVADDSAAEGFGKGLEKGYPEAGLDGVERSPRVVSRRELDALPLPVAQRKILALARTAQNDDPQGGLRR